MDLSWNYNCGHDGFWRAVHFGQSEHSSKSGLFRLYRNIHDIRFVNDYKKKLILKKNSSELNSQLCNHGPRKKIYFLPILSEQHRNRLCWTTKQNGDNNIRFLKSYGIFRNFTPLFHGSHRHELLLFRISPTHYEMASSERKDFD